MTKTERHKRKSYVRFLMRKNKKSGKKNCTMIDGVSLILELIYTQKFQKAGMSILDDAKSYYVENSSVNSVII